MRWPGWCRRSAPDEALLALFRTDYYQMGYLAAKGTDARIRAEGMEGFRRRVAALRPDLADRVDAIEFPR